MRRVAISNSRLLKVENDHVTFRYRASDTGQARLCTLAVEEFIHRFLQHVLPKGFVKVRYYGFFAPGRRPQLAALRQQLTPAPAASGADGGAEPAAPEPPPPPPVVRCPACGQLMQRRPLMPTLGGLPP